jgi:hypothetical protein
MAELLKHPKVKLFITHGGMRSVEETVDGEVPMIVIPICFDQSLNAELLRQRNASLTFDLNLQKGLASDIRMIMADIGSYEETMREIKELVNDEFEDKNEESVWHIEHLLKFKNSSQNFEYVGTKFSHFQRFHIDIWLVNFSCIFLAYKIFTSVFNFVVKQCGAKASETEK